MTNCSEVTREREERSSCRTNLYLGAVLSGRSFSVPVTIRNLSSTGALVHAAAAPEEGAAVQLTRAQLSIPAIVIWNSAGRCGLRFLGPVNIKDWLPPTAHREQQRVDAVVHLVKSGGSFPNPSEPAPSIPDGQALSKDLAAVMAVLESVGNLLAENDAFLRDHPNELQSVDVAVQMLQAISEVVAGERPLQGGAKLATLRASMPAKSISSI